MVTILIFYIFMALAGVSGTVGPTTLTEAQLAAHTHATANNNGLLTNGAESRFNLGTAFGFADNEHLATSGSSQSHSHAFSGIKSGSASSLPPYYALAYIMRIA